VSQHYSRIRVRISAGLGVAWVSPLIERIGLAYTFGPPRYTYRLLCGIGLPTWAAITCMVVIAPIELLVLAGLFSTIVLGPLRAVLGDNSALVETLEDSFAHVKVESR